MAVDLTFRMHRTSIPWVAMRWTPTEERKRGRPKETCLKKEKFRKKWKEINVLGYGSRDGHKTDHHGGLWRWPYGLTSKKEEQVSEKVISSILSARFQTIFTTMVNDWLYWNDYKFYTMRSFGLVFKPFERY